MYEQPRVPQIQGDTKSYLKELFDFLKKNSMDTWKAIKNLSERKVDLSGVEGGIEALGQRIDALTAQDVGALPEGAQAADSAKLDGRTWAQLLLAMHPIGSFYISELPDDPQTLFGGTWERIKDTFLLAAGDDYEAGSMGGEAAHTLTLEEMPKHRHPLQWRMTLNSGTTTGKYQIPYAATQAGVSAFDENADYTQGGGMAHNNMPPYLTVYIWKRTA